MTHAFYFLLRHRHRISTRKQKIVVFGHENFLPALKVLIKAPIRVHGIPLIRVEVFFSRYTRMMTCWNLIKCVVCATFAVFTLFYQGTGLRYTSRYAWAGITCHMRNENLIHRNFKHNACILVRVSPQR